MKRGCLVFHLFGDYWMLLMQLRIATHNLVVEQHFTSWKKKPK
jgi:hypothetical protein